jgi:acetylornithine aminotransferase
MINPVLAEMAAYPFTRLEEERRRLLASGVDVIDFGKGDPNEPTDPMIRRALVEALPERAPYPLAQGLPELREAAALWLERRFGVAVDPASEIVPTYGSKEAIFSLAQVLGTGGRTVAFGEPAYPVYERGALFAGASVQTLPLRRENGFLPDLEELDDDVALVWVNYPHNPTGAVASREFYDELAAAAERHDFVVGSDEAYTELWFEEPPPSALQAADRSRLVVFQTLSKRSSMTGYRSGFVAGPAEIVAALKAYRPTVGTAPQEFVQRASVVAWNDERHVEETRARYRAKRKVLMPAIEARGWEIVASEATMYLWVVGPDPGALLERGIIVSPGEMFGPSGEGYVRFALVPTLEECERAAVAEKVGGDWRVNEEAKAAILEYFRVRRVEPIEIGPFEYLDKIPLKHGHAEQGVRVVPPATARYGSFLSPGVILMPSYVNIGAWVGPNTMVDTWATVGSCAQIGADVHLAGGVGIGGVLEPVQARPVIVEDGAFVGSRCILTEGVLIGERAVLAPNVSLTGSVPVIDVTGPEPIEHRGYVPPRAVVVPGTRPKEFPAGRYEVACALVVGWRSTQTDLKTSLNDVLREFEIGT